MVGRASRTVVHLGYYKTATTALQERFFPRLPGCTALVRVGRHQHPQFEQLARNLLHAPDDEYLGATLAALLEDVADEGTLVLSDERLTGDVYDGSYNRARTADRLARLLPEAHVLLCVRAQPSLIRSLYSEYVQKGGYASFRDFVDNRAEGCRFVLDDLRFDELLRDYEERFGAGAVKVVPYELSRDDPGRFLAEIASFVVPGATLPADTALGGSNRSWSRPTRAILRLVNRWFRRSAFNPTPRLLPLISDDRTLQATPQARVLRKVLTRADHPRLLGRFGSGLSKDDQRLLERVAASYTESNARLATITGLDLRRWGYPIPAEEVATSGAPARSGGSA